MKGEEAGQNLWYYNADKEFLSVKKNFSAAYVISHSAVRGNPLIAFHISVALIYASPGEWTSDRQLHKSFGLELSSKWATRMSTRSYPSAKQESNQEYSFRPPMWAYFLFTWSERAYFCYSLFNHELSDEYSVAAFLKSLYRLIRNWLLSSPIAFNTGWAPASTIVAYLFSILFYRYYKKYEKNNNLHCFTVNWI